MQTSILAALTLATLTLAAAPTPARADDCAGRSVTTLHAGRFAWVDLRWATPGQWELRTTPGAPRAPTPWRPVPDAEGRAEHAHLTLVTPATQAHFLVLDGAAEHTPLARVRIYDAAGHKVLSYALTDLMSAAEVDALSRSISHMRWLADHDAVALEPDGDTVRLTLATGRVVRIALGRRPGLLP